MSARTRFLTRALTGIAAGIAVTISGCANGTQQPAAQRTPAAHEANGGEAPAVSYSDTRYHYRIDAPGHMTAKADGTAAFVGPSERLEVRIVEGAVASDLGALARTDLSTLPDSAPGLHVTSGPGSITLGAYKAQKFVYTWDAGSSEVTGKAQSMEGVRYYIPKDAATVAVVTYGIVSNQYDPQGADDIAGTFRWE